MISLWIRFCGPQEAAPARPATAEGLALGAAPLFHDTWRKHIGRRDISHRGTLRS